MIANLRHLPRPRWTLLAAIVVLLCAGIAGAHLGLSGSAKAHPEHIPHVRAGSAGPRLPHTARADRRRHGRSRTARASAGRRGRRSARASAATSHWISAWGASPQAPIGADLSRRGFDNQTVREIVYTSIGGSQARLELSNVFGSKPLYVGVAAVGPAGQNGNLSGSSHVLKFGGKRAVLIPPGAAVVSDPVSFAVQPLERLAISLYLPHATGGVTNHFVAQETNYVAGGNHAAQTSDSGFDRQTKSWYIADRLDVLAPAQDEGALVALGDSITDGVDSTLDGNDRWPNLLAKRFNDASASQPVLSVIDEGIGGNRILNNAPCCGENAVARFQRDVEGQPGVKEVILLEGVNDITYAAHRGALTAPHTNVSAAQIIDGDEMIIAQAHADGLKIYGATITPFQGDQYWNPTVEAKREAVNSWIESSGAFDGVIDFAKVLADPTDPERLNPVYASADNLHPNPLGYAAMAQAVDIGVLSREG